jgi:hypothetical protein
MSKFKDKRPFKMVHSRIPPDVKTFLEQRAAANFTNQNFELVRCIRAQMAAEVRRARQSNKARPEA